MSLRPSLGPYFESLGSSADMNDMSSLPSVDSFLSSPSSLSLSKELVYCYEYKKIADMTSSDVSYVYSGTVQSCREVVRLQIEVCSKAEYLCLREERVLRTSFGVFSGDLFHTHLLCAMQVYAGDKNMDYTVQQKYLSLVLSLDANLLAQYVRIPDYYYIKKVLAAVNGTPLTSFAGCYSVNKKHPSQKTLISALMDIAVRVGGKKHAMMAPLFYALTVALQGTSFYHTFIGDICLLLSNRDATSPQAYFSTLDNQSDQVVCTSIPTECGVIQNNGSNSIKHILQPPTPVLPVYMLASTILSSQLFNYTCGTMALSFVQDRHAGETVSALRKLTKLEKSGNVTLLELLKNETVEQLILDTPADAQMLAKQLSTTDIDVTNILRHIFRHPDLNTWLHLDRMHYLRVLAPQNYKQGKFFGLPEEAKQVQSQRAFVALLHGSKVETLADTLFKGCFREQSVPVSPSSGAALFRMVENFARDTYLSIEQWQWWCQTYKSCKGVGQDVVDLPWKILSLFYNNTGQYKSITLDIGVFQTYFTNTKTVSVSVAAMIVEMFQSMDLDVSVTAKLSVTNEGMQFPSNTEENRDVAVPVARTLLALLFLYAPELCPVEPTQPALALCKALGQVAKLGGVFSDLWTHAVHTIVNTKLALSSTSQCLWELQLLQFYALAAEEPVAMCTSPYISFSADTTVLAPTKFVYTAPNITVHPFHSVQATMQSPIEMYALLPQHPLLSVYFFFLLIPYVHLSQLHSLELQACMDKPEQMVPLRDISAIHRIIYIHTQLPLPIISTDNLSVCQLLVSYLADTRLRAAVSVMFVLSMHIQQYHWEPSMVSYTCTGPIPSALCQKVQNGQTTVKGHLVKKTLFPLTLLASNTTQLVVPHDRTSQDPMSSLHAMVDNQINGTCQQDKDSTSIATGIATWMSIIFCGVRLPSTMESSSTCGCPAVPMLPSSVYAIASLMIYLQEHASGQSMAHMMLHLFTSYQPTRGVDSLNWPFLHCLGAATKSIDASFFPTTEQYIDTLQLPEGDIVTMPVFRKEGRGSMAPLCPSKAHFLKTVHGQVIVASHCARNQLVPCYSPLQNRVEADLHAVVSVLCSFIDSQSMAEDIMSIRYRFSYDTVCGMYQSLPVSLGLLRLKPRLLADATILYKHTVPAFVLSLATLPQGKAAHKVCPLPHILSNTITVDIATEEAVMPVLAVFNTIAQYLHLKHPSLLFIQQNCVLSVIFAYKNNFLAKMRILGYLYYYYRLVFTHLLGLPGPFCSVSTPYALGSIDKEAVTLSADVMNVVLDCVATENMLLLNVIALYLYPELNNTVLTGIDALQQLVYSNDACIKFRTVLLQSLHTVTLPVFLTARVSELYAPRKRRLAWESTKLIVKQPFEASDVTRDIVTPSLRSGMSHWTSLPGVSPAVTADPNFCSAVFFLAALKSLGLFFSSISTTILPKNASQLLLQWDLQCVIGSLQEFLQSPTQIQCMQRALVLQAVFSMCERQISEDMYKNVLSSFSEFIDQQPETKSDSLTSMFAKDGETESKLKNFIGDFQHLRIYCSDNNVQYQCNRPLATYIQKDKPRVYGKVPAATLFDTKIPILPQYSLLLASFHSLVLAKKPKPHAQNVHLSTVKPTPLYPISVRPVLAKYYDEDLALTMDGRDFVRMVCDQLPLQSTQNTHKVNMHTLLCQLGYFQTNASLALQFKAMAILEYQYYLLHGRRMGTMEGWDADTDPAVMHLTTFSCFAKLHKQCKEQSNVRATCVSAMHVLAFLGTELYVPPALSRISTLPPILLRSDAVNVVTHLRKWVEPLDYTIQWNHVFNHVHPHVFAVQCLRRWVLPLMTEIKTGAQAHVISTVVQMQLEFLCIDVNLIAVASTLKLSSFLHQDKRHKGSDQDLALGLHPQVNMDVYDKAGMQLLDENRVNMHILWNFYMVSPFTDQTPYVKNTYNAFLPQNYSRFSDIPMLVVSTEDWLQQLLGQLAMQLTYALQFAVARDQAMLHVHVGAHKEEIHGRLKRMEGLSKVLESMSYFLQLRVEPSAFFMPQQLQLSLQLAGVGALKLIQNDFTGTDYYRFIGTQLRSEDSDEYPVFMSVADWPLLYLHKQLHYAMTCPHKNSCEQVQTQLDVVYDSTIKWSRFHITNMQYLGTHKIDASLSQFAFYAPLYNTLHQIHADPVLSSSMEVDAPELSSLATKYPWEFLGNWDHEQDENSISNTVQRYTKSANQTHLWRQYYSEWDLDAYNALGLDPPSEDACRELLAPQLMPAQEPQFPVSNHPFAPGPYINPRGDPDRSVGPEPQLLCPYTSALQWRQLDQDLEAGAWQANPQDAVTMNIFTQPHIAMYRHRLAHISSKFAVHDAHEHAENILPVSYLADKHTVSSDILGKRVANFPYSSHYRVAMPVSSHIHPGIDATKKMDVSILIKESIALYAQMKQRPMAVSSQRLVLNADSLESYRRVHAYPHEWKVLSLLPCLPMIPFIQFAKQARTTTTAAYTENYYVKYTGFRTRLLLCRFLQVPMFLTDYMYIVELSKQRDRRRMLQDHLAFPRVSVQERQANSIVPYLGSDQMLVAETTYAFLRDVGLWVDPKPVVVVDADTTDIYYPVDSARAISTEELDTYLNRAQTTCKLVQSGIVTSTTSKKQQANLSQQCSQESASRTVGTILKIHNSLNLPALHCPSALQLPLIVTPSLPAPSKRKNIQQISDFAVSSGIDFHTSQRLVTMQRSANVLLSKDTSVHAHNLFLHAGLGDPLVLEDVTNFYTQCSDLLFLSTPLEIPEYIEPPQTTSANSGFIPWSVSTTTDADMKHAYAWTDVPAYQELQPALCERVTAWGDTVQCIESSIIAHPSSYTMKNAESLRVRMIAVVTKIKDTLQCAVCQQLQGEPAIRSISTQPAVWLLDSQRTNDSISSLDSFSGSPMGSGAHPEAGILDRQHTLSVQQEDVPTVPNWCVALDYAVFGQVRPTAMYLKYNAMKQCEEVWYAATELRRCMLLTLTKLQNQQSPTSAYHGFLARCCVSVCQDLTIFIARYGTDLADMQRQQNDSETINDNLESDQALLNPALLPLNLATIAFQTGIPSAATYRVLGELHLQMYKEIVVSKHHIYEEQLSSVRVRAANRQGPLPSLCVEQTTLVRHTPSAFKHYYAHLNEMHANMTSTAVKAILFSLTSIRKDPQAHQSQSIQITLMQLVENFEQEVEEFRLPLGHSHEHVYGQVWKAGSAAFVLGTEWAAEMYSAPSDTNLMKEKPHLDQLGPLQAIRWLHNGIRELDYRVQSGSVSLFSGKLASKSSSIRAAMITTQQRMAEKLPHHVFWHLLKNTHKSDTKDRSLLSNAEQCATIIQEQLHLKNPEYRTALRIVTELVRVADCKVEKGRSKRKQSEIPSALALQQLLPTWLCVPTEAAFDACVRNAYTDSTFTMETLLPGIPVSMAYDTNTYIWAGLQDELSIFSSKEMPKKLDLITVCGKTVPVIVKREPQGDMRKDAKTMETINLVNRLLDSGDIVVPSYHVTVIGSKFGILEFVSHAMTIRALVKEFNIPLGRVCYNDMIMQYIQQQKQKLGSSKQYCSLEEFKMLKRINPPVLSQAMRYKCTSAQTWMYRNRLFSTHTAAWTIIGYVLGLGDRHTDNIMVLTTNWSVCHVDFDCLFEKGATLPTPEVVPARLTQNIIDGLGVHGLGGLFNQVCVKTLRVMRTNGNLLLPIFDAFIEDVSAESDRKGPTMKALREIKEKIQGKVGEAGSVLQVHNQVNKICKDCTDDKKLAQMFIGWSPWI